MLWLDSTYPPEKEGSPGAARGPCPQDSGVPADVEASIPDAYVSAPDVARNLANSLADRLSGPTSASDPLAPPSTFKWASPDGGWVEGTICWFKEWMMLLFFVYTERRLLYARFSVDIEKMICLCTCVVWLPVCRSARGGYYYLVSWCCQCSSCHQLLPTASRRTTTYLVRHELL